MKTSTKMKAISLGVIILGALAGPAMPQGTSDKESFVNPKDIKWGDAPPSLPKGAKIAVLQGDPGKPGPFVIRLMVPAGYKLAPHWHSQDESLTVISGTLYFGLGRPAGNGQSPCAHCRRVPFSFGKGPPLRDRQDRDGNSG